MPKNGWSTIIDNTRICKTCNLSADRKPINCTEQKHHDHHQSRINASQKYYSSNTDKVKKTVRRYENKNREQIKINHYEYCIKRKYGISREDVEKILIAQNFVCAICKKPFTITPFVDHDHKSGKVRGLLCRICNLGIGWIEMMNIKTCNEYLKYQTITQV